MVGYENLLAVVSHYGPPIKGFQSLRVKIIDMSSPVMQIVKETECPLCKDAIIQWIGFSEEGQLYTMDE